MQKKSSNYTKNLRSSSRLLLVVLACLLACDSALAVLEKVATAKTQISLGAHRRLEIQTDFSSGCYDGDELDLGGNCAFTNHLNLFSNGKPYSYDNLLHFWKHTLVYFVRINKGTYVSDVDNDGLPEIVIYPMIAGNNPITTAYIYTVKGNDLIFYGTGRFNFELGPHVIEIKKGVWIEPLPAI